MPLTTNDDHETDRLSLAIIKVNTVTYILIQYFSGNDSSKLYHFVANNVKPQTYINEKNKITQPSPIVKQLFLMSNNSRSFKGKAKKKLSLIRLSPEQSCHHNDSATILLGSRADQSRIYFS